MRIDSGHLSSLLVQREFSIGSTRRCANLGGMAVAIPLRSLWMEMRHFNWFVGRKEHTEALASAGTSMLVLNVRRYVDGEGRSPGPSDPRSPSSPVTVAPGPERRCVSRSICIWRHGIIGAGCTTDGYRQVSTLVSSFHQKSGT